MSDKIYCTFCGKDGKESVAIIRWNGKTIPEGMGLNIIHTYVCSSCEEAARFATQCVYDGSFISINNYTEEK